MKLTTILAQLLVMALAWWQLPLGAAEAAEPEAVTPEQQDGQQEQQQAAEPTAGETAETPTEPGKRQGRSEPLKRFNPTEEIIADNAVPFPVDI